MRQRVVLVAVWVAAIAAGAGAQAAHAAGGTAAQAAGTAAQAAGPPATRAAVSPPRGLTGACLAQQSTGRVLYTFAAERRLAIASTTKLMTALVVLRQVANLGRVFTQNDYRAAAEDSQIGLVPGDRVSVRDLIVAMMLPSADDAAEDLAYNVGHGSVARFIAMMNAQGRELGLAHTHFSTPIGFDMPGNYSSPCDLVKLARYDLRTEPFLRRVVDMREATIRIDSRPLRVTNLNSDLFSYPWVNGVKTGHTADAGWVLVISGTREGMTLVGDVLGAPTDAASESEGAALLRWGFEHFHLVRPVRAGEVVARLAVAGSPGERAAVIAARTATCVVRRGQRVRERLLLPSELRGPLRRGARVGTLELIAGRRRLAAVPLVLPRALDAVSVLTAPVGAGNGPVRIVELPLALCLLLVWPLAAMRRWGGDQQQHDHHRYAQRRA